MPVNMSSMLTAVLATASLVSLCVLMVFNITTFTGSWTQHTCNYIETQAGAKCNYYTITFNLDVSSQDQTCVRCLSYTPVNGSICYDSGVYLRNGVYCPEYQHRYATSKTAIIVVNTIFPIILTFSAVLMILDCIYRPQHVPEVV